MRINPPKDALHEIVSVMENSASNQTSLRNRTSLNVTSYENQYGDMKAFKQYKDLDSREASKKSSHYKTADKKKKASNTNVRTSQ